MTDTTTPEVGRHSRRSAAALLAPASAAVFAGTMGWTSDHKPVVPAAATTTLTQAKVQTEHKGSDSARDADLERQVKAQIAQVRTMRRQVAKLRKDVAALRGKAPGTGTTTPPTTPPSGGGTTPAPAPTTTKPAPAPTTTKPAPAPTTTKPAPAPTTTASTGGS